MTMKNSDSFVPFAPELSTPDPDAPAAATEQAADPGRREWIKTVGNKAKYIAPTLFAITLAPDAFAQFGSPPPKPNGQYPNRQY